MKSILNKIYIHPILIITVFIFILIGRFKFIIYFMMLISIHELGHILVSLIFKWKIDKIILLPFGGLTKYNNLINISLLEEFLVSISGIIFQLMFYKVIHTYIDYKYFSYTHYFIIMFNLLPIYPLDGSKLLNILFNKITSFKNSILLTIIVSYISIILLSFVLFDINKLFYMVFVFLFIEVNKLYSDKELIFNKFIFERYVHNLNFKKEKVVKSVDNMKKDYRHLFYINNKYVTESTYLQAMFKIR